VSPLGLQGVFEQQAGEVVVFPWVEWLREHLGVGLGDYDGAGQEEEEEEEDLGPTAWANDIPAGPDPSQDDGGLEVLHGQPITDRKSTFQAHLARVTTEEQAKQFVALLKQDRKIARVSDLGTAQAAITLGMPLWDMECLGDMSLTTLGPGRC
jgi:hypothetical protein